MKKKVSKKSETPIKEVVEQAVEQIRESVEAVTEQPKRRKMVEFHILTSIMEFATEKAQLLVFITEEGREHRFWLSKALSHFVADADKPDTMICRIPAWLYFKSGLKDFVTIDRWSQVAI